MQLTKGDYIVRIDSDDKSVANHPKTQSAFMKFCPTIKIIISSAQIINTKKLKRFRRNFLFL